MGGLLEIHLNCWKREHGGSPATSRFSSSRAEVRLIPRLRNVRDTRRHRSIVSRLPDTDTSVRGSRMGKCTSGGASRGSCRGGEGYRRVGGSNCEDLRPNKVLSNISVTESKPCYLLHASGY